MIRCLTNERGTALVVAMIFLGLLTLVGLFALFNSTTELTSSARYKSEKEAFYAAEGAIEYVKGDGHYFTTTSTMYIPDPSHPNPLARDLSNSETGTKVTGTITFTNTGNPPPGSGFSAKFNQEGTMANYFVIEVTGTSRTGIESVQEEGVAKILPRS